MKRSYASPATPKVTEPRTQRRAAWALAAWQQADALAGVVERRPRDPDRLVRPGSLHHEQGRHELRQARHRHSLERFAAPQDLPGSNVEDESRPGRAPQI